MDARSTIGRLCLSRLVRAWCLGCIAVWLLVIPAAAEPLPDPKTLTGSQIMAEVRKRHESFPFVYAEQTMILTDERGKKDTRKLRRFFRAEPDRTMTLLMVMDYPAEVRGVMFKTVQQRGDVQTRVYLPALEKGFSPGTRRTEQGVMGTDFARTDFMAEPESSVYHRKKDRVVGRIPSFIVETEQETGLRVHFIRKDIFFIYRTDFYTRGGRIDKRLTRHDLKKGDRDMWEAGMILMENLKTGHSTLIKTDRRVYSRDYVPRAYFTMDWPELAAALWPDAGTLGPKKKDRKGSTAPVQSKGEMN